MMMYYHVAVSVYSEEKENVEKYANVVYIVSIK